MSFGVTDMRVFTRVADLGNLSATARELGMTPAAVSKRLTRLESLLGVRLLQRTTRHTRMTEDGQGFYERSVRILADIEETEAALSERNPTPRGKLRISAPLTFGRQHVSTWVPEFLRRYPQVRIELDLADTQVDLVQEGYDVAVRQTVLRDSALIARRLAHNSRIVCASPEYLARHGTPRTPQDLLAHNCLVHAPEQVWEFEGTDGPLPVRVRGNFTSSSGEVTKHATLAGLGISVKSTWNINDDLAEGRLVRILADFPVFSQMGLYVIYPSNRHLSPKVRAFVDYIVERVGSVPYWERDLPD